MVNTLHRSMIQRPTRLRHPRTVELWLAAVMVALAAGVAVSVSMRAEPPSPPPAAGPDPGPSSAREAAPEPSAQPDPLEELETTIPVEDWRRLADCESGEWVDGEPDPGSARWDYGLEVDHGDSFEGGLNFHPRTWESFRDPTMPAHAGRANPAEEIEVAERVLEEQGWDAWPVCSRMTGVTS